MIDELDRVRSFRADEPPATDEVRLAARAALVETMANASRPRGNRRRRAWKRRAGRRTWLLRGAVAVAAAAPTAAVVVAIVVGSGSATAPASAAAAVLRQLATVAAAGPSSVPGAGQYLFVKSESDYPAEYVGRHSACVTHAIQHRELWIGANGSGLLRESVGASVFATPADRASCAQVIPRQQLKAIGPSNLWFAPRCFSLGPTNDMQALSTDPSVLLKQMRRLDGGPPGPGEDFVHVGDFLRETDASPALRAALYRAASLIPGVKLLGWVRDHFGRRGLGVGYDAHGNHSVLIFDPRTSAFMGEQVTSASPDGNSWAVYLQSRIVDKLPQRSPVRLSPPCVLGAGSMRQTRFGTVMTGGRTAPHASGLQPKAGG